MAYSQCLAPGLGRRQLRVPLALLWGATFSKSQVFLLNSPENESGGVWVSGRKERMLW